MSQAPLVAVAFTGASGLPYGMRLVECLLQAGCSQLLFVSHHPQDAPRGLTHRLSFVPREQGGYLYVSESLPGAENGR